jgi:GNAT superfamily N-acetyltransferase
LSARIRIRSARAQDAEELARLFTELGYPADAAAVRSRLSRLRRLRKVAVFSAVADDRRVVGSASVHLLTLVTQDTDSAYLTLLVVAASHRQRGIGKALVDRATKFAASRGAGRLVLTSHLRRADAHAFYEHIGFEFTGRRYVKSLERSSTP